jgi:hypothetical protein
VFRFGATRSALRVTPLPGLTAVAGDEVGRLWLVRGNEVWCLPPGEAAAFPWRSFGAPVDVLAACRDRLAVCVGGDLLEFITTDPRRPLWGRPLPGGSAGVLARLPGDRLALGGSEPWPRVLVLAGEGEPAGEVPLPGSCLGLAVAGGAIIARVGRPGGEASAWRADPATGTPERLDASGEVVALAAAPAGEAVFGLCTDGVTHRWAADGPGVTATRFPDGPAWVALAVAGGCFAALGRKGDASWAHARIPADDPTGGMA